MSRVAAFRGRDWSTGCVRSREYDRRRMPEQPSARSELRGPLCCRKSWARTIQKSQVRIIYHGSIRARSVHMFDVSPRAAVWPAGRTSCGEWRGPCQRRQMSLLGGRGESGVAGPVIRNGRSYSGATGGGDDTCLGHHGWHYGDAVCRPSGIMSWMDACDKDKRTQQWRAIQAQDLAGPLLHGYP
jgi:hypothetical protein